MSKYITWVKQSKIKVFFNFGRSYKIGESVKGLIKTEFLALH